MARAERIPGGEVIAQRQHAAGGDDALPAYDHGPIVQGRVGHKDVDQQVVGGGAVQPYPRARVILQAGAALQGDERADMLAGQARAGVDDGVDRVPGAVQRERGQGMPDDPAGAQNRRIEILLREKKT